MAGTFWICSLLVSSAWTLAAEGSPPTAADSTASFTCSDAEIYLHHDWNLYSTCCAILYPNETCPIACPCRNGADCVAGNRTCVCKPGWLGPQCQRSCRDASNTTYGVDCKRSCRCGPDASCDPVTGACECQDSENCASRCPRNRYGPKCRKKCRCKDGGCDHVTGTCNVAEEAPSDCGCLHGGSCPADGKPCRCPPAWRGRACDEPCPTGFYGESCSAPCACRDNGTCSRATGICKCAASDSEYPCRGRCPDGFYGPRCSFLCSCPIGLTCNTWTGDCECVGSGSCRFMIIGRTTESETEVDAAEISTSTTPEGANHTGETGGPPPSQPSSQTAAVTRNTGGGGSGRTTFPTAVKRGGGPTESGGPSTPSDGEADAAGTGGRVFTPTGAFWAVVGAIGAMLVVVVVLLMLILRRQIVHSRSALTRRQPKTRRQDNVYETVEDLGKSYSAQAESECPPPPLPIMFQRAGSTKSGVRGGGGYPPPRRPLSVHSPLPAMDAPLPASVAAMVCDYGPGTAPAPGGTSRRSLMAEWRPHSQLQQQQQQQQQQEEAVSRASSRAAKTRSQSSIPSEEPARSAAVSDGRATGRSAKALSCIFNGVTIEDDYADPFDSIAPGVDANSNRPAGYLPKLQYGTERGCGGQPAVPPRGGSPLTLQQRPSSPMTLQQRPASPMAVQRPGSPMAVHRSASPMTVQRCDSPITRSSSLASFHRSQSPLTLGSSHQSLVRQGSDPNLNLRAAEVSSPFGSGPCDSPQRQSAGTDPFYFTLESGSCQTPSRMSTADMQGDPSPEDDYDELEPSHPEDSSPGPAEKRSASSRTSSERSLASSRGSVSTSSPTTLGSNSPFGSSPCDVDMFPVPDLVGGRPPVPPQRPPSGNVYESCGPPRPAVPVSAVPLDDHGLYSRLNRHPAPRSDLMGPTDVDTGTYGRLQRSYSAKTPARAATIAAELSASPYGHPPQRSRSAFVRGGQPLSSSAECVAGEWVNPGDGRPRLPPRLSKAPACSEPRKKGRWSIRSKKQAGKKSSGSEEMEYDGPAALPHLADC